ncbi:MAG: glycosyltransferase family 2 protein [Gammaproteobacteria bacterium]
MSNSDLIQVRRDWNGPRPPVSVVILTLNEESNMADCLDSCAWCDDVHVLDSGSKDRTMEISRRRGAKTYFNNFESFGKQRNWAIDNTSLRHDWVFHLDADERFTPGIIREMDALLKTSPTQAGFYVRSKLIFMGRWLKWTAGYPTYQVRLSHRKRMRFQDYGHGQREDTENVGKLHESYLHYNFSHGPDDWFDRHNRYSTKEAAQGLEEMDRMPPLPHLFGGDRVRRRRWLKAFSYRLPLRGPLMTFYTMFVQLGFLDGAPGWHYVRMRSIYQSMIDVKMAVLRQEGRVKR